MVYRPRNFRKSRNEAHYDASVVDGVEAVLAFHAPKKQKLAANERIVRSKYNEAMLAESAPHIKSSMSF